MTSYRHKMLSCYSYLPILYGPRFLPSDAADSAGSYSASPWIPLGWPTLSSEGTCEDKGPFVSGRPSFALFSKYLNSDGCFLRLFSSIHVDFIYYVIRSIVWAIRKPE